MLTKLEAGKTYRLINKAGWFSSSIFNKDLYDKHFVNGSVTLTKTGRGGGGYVGEVLCIASNEFEFFEELGSSSKEISLLTEINETLKEILKCLKDS
jgi:hypothetical protein